MVPQPGQELNAPENEGWQHPLSRRGLVKYMLLGFSTLATAGDALTPISGSDSPVQARRRQPT